MTKIFVVRREGGSRIVAITKIIPADWIIVEMSVVKTMDSTVTVEIKKVV